MSTATAMRHLLARDSDFQTSWYLSAVIFGGIVLTAWGMWLVFGHLRLMWRRGDHGMALALGSAATVAFLMFASMLTTVAIALWPLTRSGGAG